MSKKYIYLFITIFLMAVTFGLVSHYLVVKKYSIIESTLIYYPVAVLVAFVKQSKQDKRAK